MTNPGMVEQLMAQIGGTTVEFTTPEPFHHSTDFTLRFTFGGGAEWRKGEWVGLFKPGDDDSLVGERYYVVTQADHARGAIDWAAEFGPQAPGQYEFRYFADPSCAKKLGTSAAVFADTKDFTVNDLASAVRLLTGLRPHIPVLSQLVTLVQAQVSDPPLLHPRSLDLSPRVLESYPLLQDMDAADIRRRFRLLQRFNADIRAVMPAIDLSLGDVPWSIAARLSAFRPVLFSCVKRRLLDHALQVTESGQKATITFNRARAAAATDAPPGSLRARGTMWGQLHDALREAPRSSMRVSHDVWAASFAGEGADDAGGPYRESIDQMCGELQAGLGNAVGLLVPTPNNVNGKGQCRAAYTLNPDAVSDHYLSQFEFLGVFLGIAIRTRGYLNLTLPPLLWKRLACEPVSGDDLRDVDEVACAALDMVRNIDDDLDDDLFEDLFEGTFTTRLSGGREVELVPGGRSHAVTLRNRLEYCQHVVRARLTEAGAALAALRAGLASMIPLQVLRLFTAQEVEQLTCGQPEFDLALLRSCTTYNMPEHSPEIGYLWAVLEEFTHDQLALFLRFVWGRSRLPLRAEDFDRKMTIEHIPAARPDEALPKAHTCFFRLDLPRYSSVDICRTKILYAITNCQAIDMDFAVSDLDSWRELENPSHVTF